MICVFHKALSGKDTMALHSESTMAVIFPKANKSESYKFLKAYMSFNTQQLELVDKIAKRSRYLAVKKTYPTTILSEKIIKVL